MLYRVIWEIEIEAGSPDAAVLKAREIQLDPLSTATHFKLEWPNGDATHFAEFDHRLLEA